MKLLMGESIKIMISIVSHGQFRLISNLLEDLQRFDLSNTLIVITINIPEDLSALNLFKNLPISLIQNKQPKGFGDNHNSAFESAYCDFFVIVNPDIRLESHNVNLLLSPFLAPDVGAVAPVILSPGGHIQDSVRRFPSVARLSLRILFRKQVPDYSWGIMPIDVDWSAGMFVIFRTEAFKEVGGFDSRYFMYMEDADICLRLKRAGWRTLLQPACSVVHDAQRASRRSFRHLQWHLASAFRFLFCPKRKVTSVR
jgi:N-acetylglucosaminyl-diphospho-decaprenol L-rhamnosyltransferase